MLAAGLGIDNLTRTKVNHKERRNENIVITALSCCKIFPKAERFIGQCSKASLILNVSGVFAHATVGVARKLRKGVTYSTEKR